METDVVFERFFFRKLNFKIKILNFLVFLVGNFKMKEPDYYSHSFFGGIQGTFPGKISHFSIQKYNK